MHRNAYEFNTPLNTYYNQPPNQVYGQQFGSDPRYNPYFGEQPNNYHAPVSRPDVYEGSNDTTLRAEERNWYIENHKNNLNGNQNSASLRNHETLPRTSKDQQRKEEDKVKQELENNAVNSNTTVTRRVHTNGRLRRKEDRCSCECWPTGSPEAALHTDHNHQAKTFNQSAVDMVASYGVYQNPHEDDDDQSGFVRITNRGYPYQQQYQHPQQQHPQQQQQGLIVNEAGDSSVIPRNGGENQQTPRSLVDKCCAMLSGGSSSTPGAEVDCWVTCCKPAIFLFLLILMLVVFALVSGLLVYYNCKYYFYYINLKMQYNKILDIYFIHLYNDRDVAYPSN